MRYYKIKDLEDKVIDDDAIRAAKLGANPQNTPDDEADFPETWETEEICKKNLGNWCVRVDIFLQNKEVRPSFLEPVQAFFGFTPRASSSERSSEFDDESSQYETPSSTRAYDVPTPSKLPQVVSKDPIQQGDSDQESDVSTSPKGTREKPISIPSTTESTPSPQTQRPRTPSPQPTQDDAAATSPDDPPSPSPTSFGHNDPDKESNVLQKPSAKALGKRPKGSNPGAWVSSTSNSPGGSSTPPSNQSNQQPIWRTLGYIKH
jgi:hypothetical protein